MSVLFKYGDNILTAYIGGDIDHHCARAIREEIDTELSKAMPSQLRLDFSHVDFMDSSGVGLIMGRYKLCQTYNCRLSVANMPPNVRKIISLSGLKRLIEIE